MSDFTKKYPSVLLENAVNAIQELPGIGSRTALRLALYLLRRPKENVHYLTNSISTLRNDIKYCSICKMLSDNDICAICSDRSRDRALICVVENVQDVMSIEATGEYRGLYHVLGALISPMNGISPDDLHISSLLDRLDTLKEENISPEIIFALNASVDGEMTNFYLFKKLQAYNVTISTLARGLAFGDDLEYADELSLARSIQNRQLFNPNSK